MVNLIAASTDDLKTQIDFPCEFRILPDIRIPLSDGIWLHARIWMPLEAETKPLPAVVEYAPFRHRDFTAPRDALIHPWFAGHGYVSLRIELRGSGDSGGLPQDEYVKREQDDALEALAWIAGQPWCDGNTGMFGMSWGAFSALQVAARRPPSLRAIIPVHGTDDRFSDDIHYKGGCLLTAGLSWGTLYTLYMMRPPDPLLTGNHWKTAWLERCDLCPLVITEWIKHQYKDDYWRHGSISEDYSQINCPALIFCGWADGYTNAAMRMAEHLPQHSQVILGPWAHTYPHIAQPGPQIDFLGEAVKWWDRWLKFTDNDVEQQPRVRLWLQDSMPPATSYDSRPGTWLALEEWPTVHIHQQSRFLQENRLSETKETQTIQSICSPLANAMHSPEWLPHGVGPELPINQHEEDKGSLCFDSEALNAEFIIVGQPLAHLRLRATSESGVIYLRLIDLRPDGLSTQLSYGLLNLQHRQGLDHPKKIIPGEWMDVCVQLDNIAQSIPPGHRLRLSISTQAWPLVWPAIENSPIDIMLGRSELTLPLIDTKKLERLPASQFEQAKIPEPLKITWQRSVNRERRVTRDEQGKVSRRYIKDDGTFRIEEHNLEIDSWGSLSYYCHGEDPLTARAVYEYRIGYKRDTWRTGVECQLSIHADLDNFYVNGEYRLLEGGTTIKTRVVDKAIKRANC